jgi:Amt family ammonium transporter
LKAVLITLVYSFIVTFVILKIVDALMHARVTELEETTGLDLTQHHEGAYTMLE